MVINVVNTCGKIDSRGNASQRVLYTNYKDDLSVQNSLTYCNKIITQIGGFVYCE